MADMKKVYGDLIIINLYNGQKINVVYECPHIYGNALHWILLFFRENFWAHTILVS